MLRKNRINVYTMHFLSQLHFYETSIIMNETKNVMNVLKTNNFNDVDFTKQKIDFDNFRFYTIDLQKSIKSLKIEKNDAKRQQLINDCKRFCTIERYLQLLHDAKIKYSTSSHSHCKYLRQQLRKLNHYGAMRNRTYFDKNTKQNIIIEKQTIDTSKTNNDNK